MAYEDVKLKGGTGYGKTSGGWEPLPPSFKDYTERKSAGAEGMKGRAQIIGKGIDLYSLFKPIVITALAVLFIWGPGFVGLLTLVSSMSWWMWSLAILVGLIAWRMF